MQFDSSKSLFFWKQIFDDVTGSEGIVFVDPHENDFAQNAGNSSCYVL